MPPPTPRRCLGGHRRHPHSVSVVDRQVARCFSTLISSLQRLEFLGRLPVSDAIRGAIAQFPEWAWQVAPNAQGTLV